MIDTGSGGTWRMYPMRGTGIAAVSLHPTEAALVQERGWLRVDGKKASVQHTVCTEDSGNVMLRIMFEDEWTQAHP
jgi:hypothetical protein